MASTFPLGRLFVYASALALGISPIALSATSSSAHNTSHLGYVSTSDTLEDGVRNYDFNSQTVASSNVDWPMTITFMGNATINSVKANAASMGYTDTGGTKNGRISDAAPSAAGGCGNWCWDTDGGIKTDPCGTEHGSGSTDTHFRLYAPGAADRMYNTFWSYYVPASSHLDIHDSIFCVVGPVSTVGANRRPTISGRIGQTSMARGTLGTTLPTKVTTQKQAAGKVMTIGRTMAHSRDCETRDSVRGAWE
jgi:hypothetical protein